MAVDKNLFLYDLSAVAIMKNAAPYVKEWINYHLLAGVQHFYIYDNDSPDNFKEVLQPYINSGIVTYIFYPIKHQDEAYNEAKRDFRFFSRYMAFIDDDEFIMPKSRPTISEVVDEVLSSNSMASGLSINWRLFGSNNQESADYSKGVLERFTRSDAEPHDHIKTVYNPRRIKFFFNPHFCAYFTGCYSLNERGQVTRSHQNIPPSDDKIVINHYNKKSREEYINKVHRGYPDNWERNVAPMKAENFSHEENNDIFNDSILKYCKARVDAIHGGGGHFFK